MKIKKFIPLEKQVVFPLYLCSKEVIRRYSILLKEIDLTYTQFVVMMYFWEKKTSNIKELGKTMLLDSSTLTPLLKKLEKKKLITRKKSTLDERNLVVELTKKGEELHDKAIDIPMEMRKIGKLTKEEEEVLRNITIKFLKNVEEEMQNNDK